MNESSTSPSNPIQFPRWYPSWFVRLEKWNQRHQRIAAGLVVLSGAILGAEPGVLLIGGVAQVMHAFHLTHLQSILAGGVMMAGLTLAIFGLLFGVLVACVYLLMDKFVLPKN